MNLFDKHSLEHLESIFADGVVILKLTKEQKKRIYDLATEFGINPHDVIKKDIDRRIAFWDKKKVEIAEKKQKGRKNDNNKSQTR